MYPNTMMASLAMLALALEGQSPEPAKPPPNATQAFGGEWGQNYISRCPANTFLVGLTGAESQSVESLQPLCARWNAVTQKFDPLIVGAALGTPAAKRQIFRCAEGEIIGGWDIAARGATYSSSLTYIRPRCDMVYPQGRPASGMHARFGNTDATLLSSEHEFFACAPGLVANGIYGMAARYSVTTRAGLLCAEKPRSVVGSIGRVHVPGAQPSDPTMSICDRARASRARNSPAAPNLENQCRIMGERRPTSVQERPYIPSLPPPAPPAPVPAADPPAQGRVFNSPMIVAANGQRVLLDFCREYQGACGKPAADAYCVAKGYSEAGRYQISDHVGYTAVISTGQVCDGPNCDGFTRIVCMP